MLASVYYAQTWVLTDPDPDPDAPLVTEAVPVVDVKVTVPVADVTVTIAVVVAPEAAAARAATQRLAKALIPAVSPQVRDKNGSTYRNSTMYRMIRRQTVEQNRKPRESSHEDRCQSLRSCTSRKGRECFQGIQEKEP